VEVSSNYLRECSYEILWKEKVPLSFSTLGKAFFRMLSNKHVRLMGEHSSFH